MKQKTIDLINAKCKELELSPLYLDESFNKYSKFSCNKCNKVFETKPVYLLEKDRSCPRCKPDWYPRRITIDYYKDDIEYFYKGKYTILGNEYKGNKVKIPTKCNTCNHVWDVRPNDLLTGYGCPECAKEKSRIVNLKGIDDYNIEISTMSNGEYNVISYSSNEGYTIRHNKCNHEWSETRLYPLKEKIKKGTVGCPSCSNYVSKFSITDLNKRIKEITNDDYEVQNDYITVNDKCHVKHLKCGNIFKTYIGAMIYSNKGLCPCTKQQSRSQAEDEIIEFIKSFYNGKLVLNSRSIIKPYELDIYLEDINLAIEYNGLYWHSKATISDIESNVHQYKTQLCLEKGIRLVQIFDIDWNDNKKKEKIKKVLNLLIANPNMYINNDLRWGIPLTEKEYNINEAKKVFLYNSRICSEKEHNNFTYTCGTYTRKIDILTNEINKLNKEYKRNVAFKNEMFDFYFHNEKVLIKILNPHVHNLNNGYRGNEFLKIKNSLEELDYKVLFIYQSELSKTDIIVSKIKHNLNINHGNKIYARKCEVREIDSSLKNKFLEKNHIQGKDFSTIKLGLFFNNELMSVMTFCKPRISLGHKTNSVYDYELSRFASDINVTVVGGFSKMLSYFKKNYEWENIITYADKRFSQGNLYEKNNFTSQTDSKPSYNYINLNKNSYTLEYRFKYRKQELKKFFPHNFDDSKSERQIMIENGFTQVFNLGNYVFTYTK